MLSVEVQLCFGSLRGCFGSQAWSVFYTGVILQSSVAAGVVVRNQ